MFRPEGLTVDVDVTVQNVDAHLKFISGYGTARDTYGAWLKCYYFTSRLFLPYSHRSRIGINRSTKEDMASNIEGSISPMVMAPPSANPFGMPPLTSQVTEAPTPVPEGPESLDKYPVSLCVYIKGYK